ncbi:MAG: hypothetical protein U1E05_26775, partial [Patescibacteria group bacterium]|nr:hypothetical protein [Patescibacteria group bacterium]
EATGVAGVPVGAYTIRISATVEDRANWVEGAMPEPPRKELLPARYNLQSNLTREVPTGARAMEMDFMLE